MHCTIRGKENQNVLFFRILSALSSYIAFNIHQYFDKKQKELSKIVLVHTLIRSSSF